MNVFFKNLFCFALFCMVACKHEGISGTNVLIGQNCTYSVKYDAEVTSTQQPVNTADMSRLTPQDKVGLLPHATRSVVDLCMKNNGSSEWVIEKMEPRQVFQAKSYTLPDPSPKTKTIRIVNDQATFLDASGNVIKTTAFQVNALTTGMYNLMALAKKGNTESDFNVMLEEAQKDNAEIIDMGEGIYRITKSMPTTSDRMSVMVDKTLGRVISNAVLTALGKPKYVVSFSYEKGNKPILKTVVQQRFNTSPSGIAMKSEKVIEFLKLDISGEIPNKTAISSTKD
jgi:hypothetical protein